jgi:CheY-like chemotaxis protein
MPRTILVVDDDLDSNEIFGAVLRDAGFEPVCVPRGSLALEYLRGHAPPCAILLDSYMPSMSGLEVREEMLREPSLAKIPVLAVTAAVGLEEKWRALGVTQFLAKPFDLDELLGKLETLCETRPG